MSSKKGNKKFETCPVGTHIQTLIFDKDVFNRAMSKEWAKGNEFKYGKVDEKEETYRLRQYDPDNFVSSSFRTIELTHGVKAVIGCPKSGEDIKASGGAMVAAELAKDPKKLKDISDWRDKEYERAPENVRNVKRTLKAIKEPLPDKKEKGGQVDIITIDKGNTLTDTEGETWEVLDADNKGAILENVEDQDVIFLDWGKIWDNTSQVAKDGMQASRGCFMHEGGMVKPQSLKKIMKSKLIHVDDLEKILRRKPHWCKENIGTMKFEKCLFKPYYERTS